MGELSAMAESSFLLIRRFDAIILLPARSAVATPRAIRLGGVIHRTPTHPPNMLGHRQRCGHGSR